MSGSNAVAATSMSEPSLPPVHGAEAVVVGLEHEQGSEEKGKRDSFQGYQQSLVAGQRVEPGIQARRRLDRNVACQLATFAMPTAARQHPVQELPQVPPHLLAKRTLTKLAAWEFAMPSHQLRQAA